MWLLTGTSAVHSMLESSLLCCVDLPTGFSSAFNMAAGFPHVSDLREGQSKGENTSL
jgi:hypothetical protein